MDWRKAMIESFKSELKTGMVIYEDFDKALIYAKKNSMAGKVIIDEAIKEFLNN